jgi:hypothetical protein
MVGYSGRANLHEVSPCRAILPCSWLLSIRGVIQPSLLFISPRRFRVTFRLTSATVSPLLIAMAKSLEVSPMKSLAEELEFVRKAYRESIQVYSRRVETQLTALRDIVLQQTKNPNPPPAQLRDLRDMITLCRTLDLKPEKGRRKDLKKIDTLLDELQVLVQNW